MKELHLHAVKQHGKTTAILLVRTDSGKLYSANTEMKGADSLESLRPLLYQRINMLIETGK
jgi:hypothetical protein